MALKIGIPKSAININQGAFFIDFSKKKMKIILNHFQRVIKKKLIYK